MKLENLAERYQIEAMFDGKLDSCVCAASLVLFSEGVFVHNSFLHLFRTVIIGVGVDARARAWLVQIFVPDNFFSLFRHF